MNQHDADRVQVAICGMQAAINPGVTLAHETQQAYLLALEDLGADGIIMACSIAMRTLKWFPKPVELRELVQGTPEQLAELAWEKLDRAICRAGSHRTVEFDDPIISRAVCRCGGWERVCGAGHTWLKKEFLQSYKTLYQPGKTITPVLLIGSHDRTNGRKTGATMRICGDWMPAGMLTGPQLRIES